MTGKPNRRGEGQVKPSQDLGPMPNFEEIDLDKLVVDGRYQREITSAGRKNINRIVRQFNWRAFLPVVVAGPDKLGDYAVIDGQHRIMAAREHPLVDAVPCWVIGDIPVGEQAGTFLDINRNRVQMTGINKFWAEHGRGDASALAVKALCDRAGVTISKVGTGRQKPRHTIAIAALRTALKMGPETAERALKIMIAGQAECENAFRGCTILAISRLVARFPDTIDDERFGLVLSELDLDDEIEKARGFVKAVGGKMEAALMNVLAERYNKGLKKNRLDVR